MANTRNSSSQSSSSQNHGSPIPAWVSIHDVTPATLPKVDAIIKRLRGDGIPTATLLVVPGKDWRDGELDQLRLYAEQGYDLAGHGWRHQVERYGGMRHRLHSLIISKDVAEHLALDEAGIAELIERCYVWFGQNNLPAPSLYVPPAWAMGRVSKATLKRLPFRLYEFFRGVLDSELDRFERLPMVGYEADAWYRVPIVAAWNRLNIISAGRRLLRFGIHPNDFELHLRKSLCRDLRRVVSMPLSALAPAGS